MFRLQRQAGAIHSPTLIGFTLWVMVCLWRAGLSLTELLLRLLLKALGLLCNFVFAMMRADALHGVILRSPLHKHAASAVAATQSG